jgi:hypothetical protein
MGGRTQSRRLLTSPTALLSLSLLRSHDSTLCISVPITRACRCVSVPAPDWALSSRVCRRLPRPHLPGPAGFTKSNMTVFAFWRGRTLPACTRAGSDFSSRFPFIAMAVSKLPVRSCLIDGEAIVCDENGLAVFELIRRHGALASAVLCAFDLLELDGGICGGSRLRNESGCSRSYCAARI